MVLASSRVPPSNCGGSSRRGSAGDAVGRPRLFELLDDLERGEVLFLAGAFADALKQFRRLVDDVDRTDNFSSEDLDVRFFRTSSDT